MRFTLAPTAALLCAIQGLCAPPGQPARDIIARQQRPPNVGENIMCSLSSQCTSIFPAFDGTPLCADFTGTLAFLNHRLKTMTFDDLDCLAFSGASCSGTVLAGDVALGGSLTVDLTNQNGVNVSTLVSSVRCGFV